MQCQLVIEDQAVSRVHARVIFYQNRQVTMEDMNSTQGTLVNDNLIEGAVIINSGDRI
ncbi:MAG: FHA domain-containing protein [Desulfobacterales bacterium]|nr:FHA domain-containing protein [Desulfobacterales bacterium]